MENVVVNGNETKYYINNRLLLTITDLGNDNYIVDNSFRKLEGYCKNLDKYKTEIKLDKSYDKGNKRNIRRNTKMFSHDASWFCYILEEKGFVAKTMPVC